MQELNSAADQLANEAVLLPGITLNRLGMRRSTLEGEKGGGEEGC